MTKFTFKISNAAQRGQRSRLRVAVVVVAVVVAVVVGLLLFQFFGRVQDGIASTVHFHRGRRIFVLARWTISKWRRMKQRFDMHGVLLALLALLLLFFFLRALLGLPFFLGLQFLKTLQGSHFRHHFVRDAPATFKPHATVAGGRHVTVGALR